jgi:endoglucanase
MTYHNFSSRSRIPVLAMIVMVTALVVAAMWTPAASSARGVPGDPLSALPFYVDRHTAAVATVSSYREAGNSTDANLMARIADQPQAIWLGGPGSLAELTLTLAEAESEHRLPTYVLYNIPDRNCGSYSAGGAPSAAAYRSWIRQVASRLGSSPVAVIIEPDALPGITCWSRTEQATTYSLIHYAASRLAAKPNTTVYLDAGNSAWQPVRAMVARLRRAGVGLVRGFALNIANFQTTASSVAYGERISRALGGKHFVIDTSRNGRGPPPDVSGTDWTCNPPGRGLGVDPTTHTASRLVDAYLWVKLPGSSDGPCNGGPSGGDWWPSYALGLAERAQGAGPRRSVRSRLGQPGPRPAARRVRT